MSGELLWYLSRATGAAATVLLTLVVVLGVVTAGRRSPQGPGATVVLGMHRWVSLGALVFLAVHIATAILDGYVTIGWLAVLVPFTSPYLTLLVGLGTIALDLLAVVLVTSYLRHRMPERAWRGVHWASYAMWAFAVLHGYLMGTADEPLLRWATATCGIAGAAAIVWRAFGTSADRDRRRELAAAAEWS